jgi:hypothetical protein
LWYVFWREATDKARLLRFAGDQHASSWSFHTAAVCRALRFRSRFDISNSFPSYIVVRSEGIYSIEAMLHFFNTMLKHLTRSIVPSLSYLQSFSHQTIYNVSETNQ